MFPKLCSLFNFMTLLLSLTENNFFISPFLSVPQLNTNGSACGVAGRGEF